MLFVPPSLGSTKASCGGVRPALCLEERVEGVLWVQAKLVLRAAP